MSKPNTDSNALYQQALLAKVLSTKPAKLTSKSNSALQIYQNNYIENGIRALSIGFPTVFGIMQEADFRKLCRLFLHAQPKTSFDWADYGHNFAAFMFDIEALADMPFLPELAELDWRLSQIERCADKTFDAESFNLLQTNAADNLTFISAPGLQIMQCVFPLKQLYCLVHDSNLATDSLAKAALVEQINSLVNAAIKQPKYRSCILYRAHYKALFEYCEQSAVPAFNGMLKGATIASVLATFENNETAMSQWLQTHIESRKIYGIARL